MRPLSKAVLLGGGALFAGWIAWGMYSTRSAESIPYEHVDTVDGVELRRYPQTVLVETAATDERTAFRRLFGYISGANEGSESIAMTAPVETQGSTSIAMTAPVRSEHPGGDGGAVRMAFYLPPEYDTETAPEPTDETVTLGEESAKAVAAKPFSWYAPKWRVSRQERQLLAALETAGLDTVGDPFLLRYNDPWTPPFMRRNEVAVQIEDDL